MAAQPVRAVGVWDTRLRFTLLVLCAVAAALFSFRWSMYLVVDDFQEFTTTTGCWERAAAETGFAEELDSQLARNRVYDQCAAHVYATRGAIGLAGVAAVLAVAAAAALLWPRWRIRRRRLTPLDPAAFAPVTARVAELADEAGLRCAPRLLWNPLDPRASALAVRSFGRSSIAMGAGLLSLFYTDRCSFDAVVRHECGHLANRDVGVTAITVTIVPAVAVVAGTPFLVAAAGTLRFLWWPLTWRLVVLGLLVYLVRNSVLRVREHYADLAAARTAEQSAGLRDVLARLRPPRGGRLGAALSYHPSPARRLAVMADPRLVSRPSPGVLFVFAALVSAALAPVQSLASGLAPAWVPASAATAVVLLVPMLGALIGVEVWRETAEWHRPGGGRRRVSAALLGAAAGAGVVLGGTLAVTLDPDHDVRTAGLLPDNLLGVVAAASTVLASALAAAWLRTAAEAVGVGRARRWQAVGGVLGAVVFTWALYATVDLGWEAEGVHTPLGELTLAEIGGERAWLGTSFSEVSHWRLTMVLVIALWAAPLAVLVIRQRRAGAAAAGEVSGSSSAVAGSWRRAATWGAVAGLAASAGLAVLQAAQAGQWETADPTRVVVMNAAVTQLSTAAVAATAGVLVTLRHRGDGGVAGLLGLCVAWVCGVVVLAVAIPKGWAYHAVVDVEAIESRLGRFATTAVLAAAPAVALATLIRPRLPRALQLPDTAPAARPAAFRPSPRGAGTLAAVLALIVVAATAAGLSRDGDVTTTRRVLAEAEQIRSTDAALAAQLDLTGYRMRPTPLGYGRLLSAENAALSTALPKLPGAVTSVAYSADGRTIAAAGAFATVSLWNVADPHHPVRWGGLPTGHRGTITTIALGREGDLLVTGGTDRTVEILHFGESGVYDSQSLKLDGPVTAVAVAPDDGFLVAGTQAGTVWLVDLREFGRPALLGVPLTGPAGSVITLALNPSGRLLATGGIDGRARLWDLTDPAEPVAAAKPWTAHRAAIESLAFRPGGRMLATGSGDYTVRLWDLTRPARPTATGEPLRGPGGRVGALAFRPDGQVLASGADDTTVRLWNVTTTRPRPLGAPLAGHADRVSALAFGPDGRHLLSGGYDQAARLWELPATLLVGHRDVVNTVALSPAGGLLASAGEDRTIRLWNVTDPARPAPVGTPLTGHRGPIADVRFSPDGRLLASAGLDRTVRLWSTSGAALATVPRTSGVYGVGFAPDGRTLAVAEESGTVSLWNVRDPRRPVSAGPPLRPDAGTATYVAFHPDGRVLVSSHGDTTVRLWDVGDPAHPVALGKPLTGHTNWVSSATFRPDGRTLVSGGYDNTVRLWDITDPAHATALGPPLTGHRGVVMLVAFSPDGRMVASAGADHTVRLWTIGPHGATAASADLTAHQDQVTSIAFGADGRLLAAAGADGVVSVWDLRAETAAGRICATTGDVLTYDAWVRHVDQHAGYQPPCGT
ncbi:M48 family metalloprotease [Actinoplanes palleronii]|uniref:Peptidase M48 domain-containing protein n=1 Tax=Actinoplanes palleronii TaxID=113570 RepID=A0ABQ4BJ13_9ACTN|nr:M48 family metalloprotease [Actinoplanes palleronii]GIE70671.1 hypothetical protein Apa02nite_067790 [Actinoplanes palleronii]